MAHISIAVCTNDIDCLFEESEGSYMNNWFINIPISCLICTHIFYRCCINVQDSPHQLMRRSNMDVLYMCMCLDVCCHRKRKTRMTREEFTNNIIFISSFAFTRRYFQLHGLGINGLAPNMKYISHGRAKRILGFVLYLIYREKKDLHRRIHFVHISWNTYEKFKIVNQFML